MEVFTSINITLLSYYKYTMYVYYICTRGLYTYYTEMYKKGKERTEENFFKDTESNSLYLSVK